METKKVLTIIFSIVFIGAFIFALTWGIINFQKVKDGMSGSGIYTQEDLNNAYEDGYDTALTNKEEYDNLINSYRDEITELNDQVSQLNSTVINLTNSNKDYSNVVIDLNTQKTELNDQIKNLTQIKSTNETLITNLSKEIEKLEDEKNELSIAVENKDNEIISLRNQISNLQSLISQLQLTNELNVETIKSLNNQVSNLNSQISDLSLQIQNNTSNVSSYVSKIAELEKSISYYQIYIDNLENGSQVVATFEFDNSVYSIQVVNKDAILSVPEPVSIDYKIFNYWTVNGERIDLDTYQITANTNIVANITYKYDVSYIVNDIQYNTQLVTKNGFVLLPSNPEVDGYEFDGWTLNGVDVINSHTIAITENTIFVAKLTKLNTVNFMFEDEVVSTQVIRNGNYAQAVEVENTEYKTFNGWTLNDVVVDLDNYKITSSITLNADITYSYDVHFVVEEETLQSIIVVENNLASTTLAPIKENHDFKGWSDGNGIVDLTTYQINNTTTLTAIFELKTFTVNFTTAVIMGQSFGTMTVKYGETIGEIDPSIIAPEKEDHEFSHFEIIVGWTTEEIDFNNYIVTSDISILPIYNDVVSFVTVYNGENLMFNKKLADGSVVDLTHIQPMQRENMRFLGYTMYRSSGSIMLDTQNNYDKPISLPSSITTVGGKDYTYYALYEHLCAGGFRDASGETDIEISYHAYYDGSYSKDVLTDSSWAFEEYYDYEAGTYLRVSGNTEYIGTYNKDNDTWTVYYRIGKNDGTWFSSTITTLTRYAHTEGITYADQ